MTSFKFECPFCKQHLEADDLLVGQSVECPSCSKTIVVPAADQQPTPMSARPQQQNDRPSPPNGRTEINGDKMNEMKPCRACKKEVHISADICPYCGAKHPGISNEANNNIAIIGLVIFIWFIWHLFGGGLENQAARRHIKNYNFAKSNENAMDAYLYAELAARAYLKAGDDTNYKKWKEIENQEAWRAGIRRAR